MSKAGVGDSTGAKSKRASLRRLARLLVALALAGPVVAFVGLDAYAAQKIATGCFKGEPAGTPPAGARDVDYGPAHAWFTPPSGSTPTIVMVHGYPGDRGDSAGFATAMQLQGFGLLRIDLVCAHTHAQYGGGQREATEVIDAVRFARRRTSNGRVVLYGVSAGGAAALLAANAGAPVLGVVADSAPSNLVNIADYFHLHGQRWVFHLTPRLYPAVSKNGHLADLEHDLRQPYPVPTLIIQGQADTNVNPANGPRLAKLTHGQLWIVPAANHLQAFAVQSLEYAERVATFYRSVAPPGS